MGSGLILVADDHADIRRFLEEVVLTLSDYSVETVADGDSAMDRIRMLSPDLVITDHQMPGLTGLELIRQIQEEGLAIPVILITGEGSEGLAVETFRAGAVDYLIKPFEMDELQAAISRALESHPTRTSPAPIKDIGTGDLEQRLKELENLALVGRTVTAMLDVDALLTEIVKAAVRLTGAEEGSLLLLDEESGELYMRASKNFDDDFTRTFRLPVQDSLAGRVIETGEPVLLDERTPQKIKTSYLVHSLIYVPMEVHGKIIGVLGVDNRKAGRFLGEQDVLILKAMADYAAIALENAHLYQRSEDERNKLEAIMSQTENAVIVCDFENRIIIMNPAARGVLQVEEVREGASIVETIDHPQLLTLIRDHESDIRHEELEVSDGRVFAATRKPIEGVGTAIVMNDITHLKELDRIKSEFVTTVSHDLRSPLTAILGYVELIERAGPTNEQQEEFIRRVKFSVEQITNLVTDLLDLGRIEAGLDSKRECTPISVLAQYSVDGVRGLADSKGTKLEVSMEEDLPLVDGDPVRLRQMIGNLLENAIKYTPEGGTVTLETASEDSQVIMRVSDDGPGIPPGDQPYLFDKFFRASNIPEDIPGTGLGLSIVKSIVDHHNGRIWVDSELGGGTTFTVVLPAVRTE